MAGLFAARALRAGRTNFDPFGERSSSDDDDDDDDLEGVEEPDAINSEDERTFAAPPMEHKARFEKNAKEAADAAFDVSVDVTDTQSAAPSLLPITVLNPRWESPCEMIYEDDEAEVFCVRFSPDDSLVAAGCGDSVVRVFHCDDGRLAYNLEREASDVSSRMPLTCLRWRPTTSGGTKNVLLSANSDGTVQHWHVTSRKCLHTLTEDNNQVRHCVRYPYSSCTLSLPALHVRRGVAKLASAPCFHV
jgi:WD40 repeat protein